MMKARLYRLALVAGVVAVFLEGLGAGASSGASPHEGSQRP